MVEATNYVYLAILICLQYLGLQHESYEMTVNYLQHSEFEHQPPITLDLLKGEKENEWHIISKDEKRKVPISVLKNSVSNFERGRTYVTKFDEIDFNSFVKQQDTVFNTKQKGVAVITRHDKTIKFQIEDKNGDVQRIIMKIKE